MSYLPLNRRSERHDGPKKIDADLGRRSSPRHLLLNLTLSYGHRLNWEHELVNAGTIVASIQGFE